MWRQLEQEDKRDGALIPPVRGCRRVPGRCAASLVVLPSLALAMAFGSLFEWPRRGRLKNQSLHAETVGMTGASFTEPPPPYLVTASIFAPHMVLQRGEATLLWGRARPGSGPVIVQYGATKVQSSVDDATGRWEAKLPAMDATSEPSNLIINSTTTSLVLQDVVVGDVYLCSGGSQMEFDLPTVADVLGKRGEHMDSQRQWAKEHASSVRIVRVTKAYKELAQDNTTLMIPWQRMDHHFKLNFGALCYFFGVEQVKSRPDVPVGLVVAAYPSTFAEQFAPREALLECGVNTTYTGKLNEWWAPSDPGVLWNSMINPLTWLPVRAFLLEMRPTLHSSTRCLLPALLRHWRSHWHNSGKYIPMVVFQPGCGPATVHADQLRSVTAAFLKEPRTAVAITADLCDPDRVTIHSPFKELEAQRMAAIGENVIHGNKSVATSGPVPLSFSVKRDPGLCGQMQTCWRLRVTFDQEIGLKPTLEPQFSEDPSSALRKAFKIIVIGSRRVLNVTSARLESTNRSLLLSVGTASPSSATRRGSVRGEAGIISELWYATDWMPLMPLVGTRAIPVAQFKLPFAHKEHFDSRL
jgi:sialate O-acetylesterase